ncbi:DUF1513 domain-containing protein [Salinarimonas ramus]|uniref:DUF1513 domain-containing protein n=1 Tax=Salinarimonas ramus TaxID=690164 RepID=A0A917Q6S5_9HYPH|nr:DUF1513 domain-containing protein [Salinarimonas ramus]GGK31875.1 hypothetical protein GCM10011322_18110 [Salinarimonas ramus]
MAIDRRSFLAGIGAAAALALSGGSARAGSPAVYVACARAGDGSQRVCGFTGEGRLLFSTALPERGHDVAARPGSDELVVFARRPGDWMAVVERGSGRVTRVVLAAEGRHFYGHGAFSADGRVLWATESRIETGAGVLGAYDCAAGYARIGEVETGGIGPHDLAFLPGTDRLVVANGGIRTHPETGREILNPGALAPSLAVLRPESGEVEEVVELGPDLADLSIRHLAVAGDGATVFGCQYAGDPLAVVPLVGVRETSGRVRLLEMPEDDLISMENYVGSVALDPSGAILCATSPHGSVAAFFERASGRYLGRRRMSDVCGAAPGDVAGTFLVTSGNDGVAIARVPPGDLADLGAELAGMVWDNHALRL